MIVRGFSRRDAAATTSATCGRFAAFLGRSPDTATAEDLRRFQLHQHESGVQPPSINSSVSALRFFFTRDARPAGSGPPAHPVVRYPRKLPAVLSVEEVGAAARSGTRASSTRPRSAVAYGAGLRVSEVVALKVGDIDSDAHAAPGRAGKGRKDRNAMLSPQLLELLRQWWREGRRRGRDAAARLAVSRAATRSSRSRPASSTAPSTRPPRPPGSRKRVGAAHAAPQLRHPPAGDRTSTSASSRSCSGTPSSTPPRSTPRSPTRTIRAVTSPLDRLGLFAEEGDDPAAEAACAPALEVADIFRAAWRRLPGRPCRASEPAQLKVMSAIEHCRTAALGGHVEACEDCGHWRIAYNSCRNRHCPKCQGAAARDVAGRARGRPAAGRLLPRRLHAAGRGRRHRLPEQGGRLRPAVPGSVRDDADDRRRSRSISARASASPPCSTPGARR